MKSKWYVVVDGPFANSDSEWEFPEWAVQLMHDDGEEGDCYHVRSFDGAMKLGREISRDRRIKLVVDGSPS